MGIKFNAEEVFNMAIRAEENGGKFYRRAAELQSGKGENAAILLDLAAMEDGHKATFEKMRDELSEDMKESTAFDPYMEAELYLNAMTDSSNIEGAPSIADKLTGEETMEDILRTAIGLEKEAVLFYIAIADMVPEKLGKDSVEHIIKEERGHIADLAAALKKLKA